MEWLSPVLMAVQVISSLSVIVLVLLQQGKGADMGSAFGSGSAGSLFGAAGAANFLSRTTKWAAIVFFASTAGLAWMSHQPEGGVIDSGVMQGFEVPQVPGAVPVAPNSSVPSGSVPAVPAVPGDASVPAAPAAPEPAPAEAASADPAASAASGATPAPSADASVPSLSAPADPSVDTPAAEDANR